MKLSIHATRLALSALLCASTGIALAQQPERFKFAVFTPDKEQTFLTVMRPFAEAVKKDAAGTCEIDLFPNGALGRSPVQQAQMVLDGVADIAWVIASYTPGRFQENEVLELPGTFRDLREGTLVFTRLVKAGKLRGYDDFYPIGLFATAPYSLHARFAINTIADIRGKKIRASGAVESASLKALGAVPIGMPVTEVAEAVGRGTIDGTTSHPSPLFDFGLDRVTQHDYFTRLGIVPLAILMNAKRYAAAPAACRHASHRQVFRRLDRCPFHRRHWCLQRQSGETAAGRFPSNGGVSLCRRSCRHGCRTQAGGHRVGWKKCPQR